MVRIAALRAFAQRFSFAMLIVTAIGLMMLGKVDAVLMNALAARITDAVVPVMNVISRPAASIADAITGIQEFSDIRAENARLRRENTILQQYRHAAYQLEAENISLRELQNYHLGMEHSHISGRIVADNSGAFVRSKAINLGAQDGIVNGQAVLGSQALIGRIVQTGDVSARVLLLTDLNSRIPVVMEQSGARAVLAGDNSSKPSLLYLPQDQEIEQGDRVVTSGHGGIFPPGVAIGMVAEVGDSGTRVQLHEDLDRVEFVRVIDFGAATQRGQLRHVAGPPAPMPETYELQPSAAAPVDTLEGEGGTGEGSGDGQEEQ
jgi:rod shape-determining protein MreC